MTTFQILFIVIVAEAVAALFFFVRWMVLRARLAAEEQLLAQQRAAHTI